MNQDFPLFSLTDPQTAARRSEKGRLTPISSDRIQNRREKARNLQRQVGDLSRQLQEMSEEQRKAVLIKLEHEQKIPLSGTDLKAISESSQYFTLAVPRTESLENLESKIEEFGEGELIKGQPLNKYLTYLSNIKQASPKDRLCQIFFEQYDELIQQDLIICEIEMISLKKGTKQQRRELQEIRNEIEQLFESRVKGNFFEHEEIKGTCRAVIRCQGEIFKKLVEDKRWQAKIVYFEERPIFETFHQTLTDFDVKKLDEIASPPQDAPIVCIVDSGVTVGNPFLKPVVKENLIQSFLKNENKSNPYDEFGHGSGVASLASYYALNLYENAKNEGKIWIASARILNKNNEIEDERLFSKILMEVVEYFVQYGVKIFNLSLQFTNRKWYEEAKRTVLRRSWIARTIDRLSREYDIVFITITGNLSCSEVKDYQQDGLPYPKYFTDDEASIYDLGQAALALTVGSLAPTTQIVNPSNSTASAIAESHQPSPFTRCGPGINKEIKPELVEYGGNYLSDQSERVREDPGMNVMMASHQLTPAISHKSGTIFAAPRVVYKMARIIYDIQSLGFENISASLIKALTVNSANYPPDYGNFDKFRELMDEVERNHWLNIAGYGLPDYIRATDCDAYTGILWYQGEIKPNTVSYFQIPVPECLADAQTGIKRLTVTVVYAPQVQRWGLENYLGTTLKWRMFRGDVDQEDIIKSMSVENDEDDNETVENPKELKFTLGVTLRSRGTVQHGVFEWKQHRLEYSTNCYTLAIAAYEKWQRANPEPVPYAVVVRLEDTTQTSEVYAGIQTILTNLQVETQSRV